MLLKIYLLIIRAFAFFGFNLTKLSALKPVTIDASTRIEPRHISYLLKTGNGVVISAPLEQGRAFPINSLGKNGNHPFMVAARLSRSKEGQISEEKMAEVLKLYYHSVIPKNAAELMGLSADSLLSEHPAWSIVMPWDTETIDEWKPLVAAAEKFNNYQNGLNLSIEEGWTWIGPTSENKRAIEVRRLSSLLASVLDKGYLRNDKRDGDISAVLLVNEENEWVWQSINAQHRAAVVAAIGLEAVPIRVSRVIRREEAAFWPNVMSGLYTKDEAVQVFDTIFQGNYRHVTEKWDDWLKEFQRKGANNGE